MQDHWDSIYTDKMETELGWYQKEPQPDLDLIRGLKLDKGDKILIAGSGLSTVVDALLDEGYENLILTDISTIALKKLKKRLGSRVSQDTIEFIQEDLANPENLPKVVDVDLWYDRAVLHFLTEEEDINNYQKLLEQIRPCYLLLAQFSVTGADKCSGLPVRQYSENILKEFVPEGYELLISQDYTYINPNGGERPYVYSIFKNNAEN